MKEAMKKQEIQHVAETLANLFSMPELSLGIDIDLERRRISLSLKQASETISGAEDEHFDPALYGMAATYDDKGNYVYPDGFDPATGEWLPGHEAAQAEWERQYAEAHARWETHRKQVAEQRKKDAEAIAAAAEAAGEAAADAPTSYSSPSPDEGALATDEALQALRDKLSGE